MLSSFTSSESKTLKFCSYASISLQKTRSSLYQRIITELTIIILNCRKIFSSQIFRARQHFHNQNRNYEEASRCARFEPIAQRDGKIGELETTFGRALLYFRSCRKQSIGCLSKHLKVSVSNWYTSLVTSHRSLIPADCQLPISRVRRAALASSLAVAFVAISLFWALFVFELPKSREVILFTIILGEWS